MLAFSEQVLDNASETIAVAWAKRTRGHPLSDGERAEWLALATGNPYHPDSGFCATPAVTTLYEVIDVQIQRGRWRPSVRAAVDRILWAGDERFPWCTSRDERFVIEYQVQGDFPVCDERGAFDIVEPGDPAHTPIEHLAAGDVPNYVRRVQFWLRRAFDVYADPAFAMPMPAVPITVRLTNYVRSGGVPTGVYAASRIGMHHRAHPDLVCSIAVHELFHAFQWRYPGPRSWLSLIEGGATTMEDLVATHINRYLYEAGDGYDGPGVLSNPSLSLTSGGKGGYKASLFWRYLIEQRSPDRAQPLLGAVAYRQILDFCTRGADIDAAVRSMFPRRWLSRFSWVDSARNDVAVTETLLGNYILACRLQDRDVRTNDQRFSLAEKHEPIECENLYPGGSAPPGRVTPVKRDRLEVTPGYRRRLELALNMFGQKFVDARIGADVDAVEVQFGDAPVPRASLFQMALLDSSGRVIDLNRGIASFRRHITVDRGDGMRLSTCAIALSGAGSGGSCTLEIAAVARGHDVMITRWNCAPGTEYEIDPRCSPWTWTSPDIRCGSAGDPSVVIAGTDNVVFLRLHNRGSVTVDEVTIQLDYQPCEDPQDVPVLSAEAWLAGMTSRVVVPPGESWHQLAWAPRVDGTRNRLCLRAVVTVPGDWNVDNKRALSLFAWQASPAP